MESNQRKIDQIRILLAGDGAKISSELIAAFMMSAGEFELGVLEMAVSRFMRGKVETHKSHFKIKPAELAEECRAIIAQQKCNKLAQLNPPSPPEQKQEFSQEHKEAMKQRVSRMFRELQWKLKTPASFTREFREKIQEDQNV